MRPTLVQSPLPVLHGERVGVRGRSLRWRMLPPLTLTLSPCRKGHGERESGALAQRPAHDLARNAWAHRTLRRLPGPLRHRPSSGAGRRRRPSSAPTARANRHFSRPSRGTTMPSGMGLRAVTDSGRSSTPRAGPAMDAFRRGVCSFWSFIDERKKFMLWSSTDTVDLLRGCEPGEFLCSRRSSARPCPSAHDRSPRAPRRGAEAGAAASARGGDTVTPPGFCARPRPLSAKRAHISRDPRFRDWREASFRGPWSNRGLAAVDPGPGAARRRAASRVSPRRAAPAGAPGRRRRWPRTPRPR